MHHHINHCWCSHSNHDDDSYYAGHMVDIDLDNHDEEDWDKMIDTKDIVSQEKREMFERMNASSPELNINVESVSIVPCPVLKSEVVDWLNANIKLQKDGKPGWAMGNDEYRATERRRLTLWFQRKIDAKKFIRTWSKYKKATSYFNYLDNPITNLVLDIETGKYKPRHSN